ncbi:4801_t:CDS:2 [Ambispora leptoticha]|uniref:4801_t:CDS:1 n=1 Tax=Ambispora leptoticha TaxID=144679 RepID=A0A9N8WV37_9GLOM|nr:4801_t:CDS:2 [Ambispora leptoticha]
MGRKTDRLADIGLPFDINNGIRPTLPDFIPKCFANILLQYWKAEPSERPTIQEVHNALFSFSKEDYVEFQNTTEKVYTHCFSSNLSEFSSSLTNANEQNTLTKDFNLYWDIHYSTKLDVSFDENIEFDIENL